MWWGALQLRHRGIQAPPSLCFPAFAFLRFSLFKATSFCSHFPPASVRHDFRTRRGSYLQLCELHERVSGPRHRLPESQQQRICSLLPSQLTLILTGE